MLGRIGDIRTIEAGVTDHRAEVERMAREQEEL
jgi:hypothetical protein